MKRSRLNRYTELRPDPDQVREFMRRRSNGFKHHSPVPADAKREALKRQGGHCLLCSERGYLDPHHALPKDDWPDLVQLADNLLMLCRGCHANHEHAFRRVRRDELPACVLALAEREGPRALAYIDRIYPKGAA